MAVALLVVTSILSARARAESPSGRLSPGAAAGLSAGLTLTGLGLAALTYSNTNGGLVRTAVIAGGTLLIAPSIGRIAAGGDNAASWLLSRLAIGGVGTAIALAGAAGDHGGDEYGALKALAVGSILTGGALFIDACADIISTARLGKDRAVAVTPTMLGRAPGLALTGAF